MDGCNAYEQGKMACWVMLLLWICAEHAKGLPAVRKVRAAAGEKERACWKYIQSKSCPESQTQDSWANLLDFYNRYSNYYDTYGSISVYVTYSK